jgi:hypothetical protein
MKRPGLDIWKKSLLNDQYYLFLSNSKSLEQQGLLIESLEQSWEFFLKSINIAYCITVALIMFQEKINN